METLEHINIAREDIEVFYRGRSNPTAKKPPMRDRYNHGLRLRRAIDETTNNITQKRKVLGINSDNLLVIELTGVSMNRDLIESLTGSFNVEIVEECYKKETDNTNLVLQFEDKEQINQFNAERELWQNDSKAKGILSLAKRRDIFSSIEDVKEFSREDRIGDKLKKYIEENNNNEEGDFFIVNLDLWYNNEKSNLRKIESMLKQVLGTEGSELLGDLFDIDSLILARAKVNKFSLNALLNFDLVAKVELPIDHLDFEISYKYIIQKNVSEFSVSPLPTNPPKAAVIDSGVFSGNPLLKNIVAVADVYDESDNNDTDLVGHGTAVSGIVAYGDLSNFNKNNNFKPEVAIYSAKIMHCNQFGETVFPENVRIEKIISDAIKNLHKNYKCRIFNLSIGNSDYIYNGGRQFPLASVLDELSKSLDIVIIVSAGNVGNPEIKACPSRDEILENCRDQLFEPEHRLIDPATAALAVTVGSITRNSEPSLPIRNTMPTPISVGRKNYPSVFTRIGPGINNSVKPDFVDYGGNYALERRADGHLDWKVNDPNLQEASLSHKTDSIFKGFSGTSFSAPVVTNVAAKIEKELEIQLKRSPSANLIRAILACSASYTSDMIKWGETRKGYNRSRERLRQLYGYGKVSDVGIRSTDNHVLLFAEDSLPLRQFHLYKIPVPKEFLFGKFKKSIKISLAYNPNVKISRRDYLTCNLWVEVYRRLEEDELRKYKEKLQSSSVNSSINSSMPAKYKIKDFVPGYNKIQTSTLQQRSWTKTEMGGEDLDWDIENPYIYILVSGKERFKFENQDFPQDYALCVMFEYESEEQIDLYNKIKNQVRLKVRAPERIILKDKVRIR